MKFSDWRILKYNVRIYKANLHRAGYINIIRGKELPMNKMQLHVFRFVFQHDRYATLCKHHISVKRKDRQTPKDLLRSEFRVVFPVKISEQERCSIRLYF